MLRIWEIDMAAMERISEVELTGLGGEGDTGTKNVCEVSSMDGL